MTYHRESTFHLNIGECVRIAGSLHRVVAVDYEPGIEADQPGYGQEKLHVYIEEVA